MQPDAPRISAARPSIFEGWAGVVLVAATYVYFLIFAQFGFLKRLAELGITQAALPAIMAAMAAGGIGISLLAPRTRLFNCPSCRLGTGLIGCALAAAWSLFPLNTFTAGVASLVIGLSLGLLTVTLVANLPLWIGYDRPLLKIGFGTGIGYFVSNFPPLFTATPRWIAIVSGLCCLLALAVASRAPLTYTQPDRTVHKPPVPRPFDFFLSKGRETTNATSPGTASFLSVGITIAWFTALVWLDSAAFFIIQNSPGLQAGAWHGNLHLWRTAILHLAAALVGGWLLARRGLSLTLALSLAALGAACLLIVDPVRAPMAALLYPAGVSLYSVALVAWPAFLMPSASQETRARRAGYLYALAGWIGSALGIGMGRNLQHVPPAFVALAAALFIVPWMLDAIASGRLSKSVHIEALAVVCVLAAAFALTLIVQPTIRPFASVPVEDPIERGRRAYIAEGCINCHSQYVRPNTADVAMWGPATTLDELRRQRPPLIGNRRQGPDLSRVGARRSPLWLQMHFIQPRDVSYASPMPPYDYLFRNRRGDDLVAYLSSLNDAAHWKDVAGWQPSPAAWDLAAKADGAALFRQHCATCHTADGAARRKWSARFHRLPPDLALDRLEHLSPNASPSEARTEIARIARFGIQGTDMPGREYLPDVQIAAIADYVLVQRESRLKR